jgi:hypothetical protein
MVKVPEDSKNIIKIRKIKRHLNRDSNPGRLDQDGLELKNYKKHQFSLLQR